MIIQKCCGMDTSHMHLQIQVDRRGVDHLWKNKGDLQADSEYFALLGAEPRR
jgi:hypothetical protein